MAMKKFLCEDIAMNMNVQIYIPSLDNGHDIDATIESIRSQTYPQEHIFTSVTDFGSQDGSYERLFSLDPYHLGIYRSKATKNPRLMLAEMKRIYSFAEACARGYCTRFYNMVLYPGETLKPDCLKICADAVGNQPNYVDFLVCETDIMEADGSLTKQPYIYEQSRELPRIDKDMKDVADYLTRGYQHQVLVLQSNLGAAYTRLNGFRLNESRWWNKCGKDYYSLGLYIHDKTAVTKRMNYADELEEILLRLEYTIYSNRMLAEYQSRLISEELQEKSRANVSWYALWRSYLLYGQNRYKDAEDCQLIATVIDSEIEKTEQYRDMERLLSGVGGEAENQRLANYFKSHGLN